MKAACLVISVPFLLCGALRHDTESVQSHLQHHVSSSGKVTVVNDSYDNKSGHVQSTAMQPESDDYHESTSLGHEAWFCDCGRMKDVSQDGQMHYDQLSKELTVLRSNTSTLDHFVNWRTKSPENRFFAFTDEYWNDGVVTTYGSKGECMSECLLACNSKEHPATRFKSGYAGRVGQAISTKVFKKHHFARCIPKKDWTCAIHIQQYGVRILKSIPGLPKAMDFVFHNSDFSVVSDPDAKNYTSLMATFLYVNPTFAHREVCESQCPSLAEGYPSWTCHFYPSPHFLDYPKMYSRQWKNIGVKQWGCCEDPYHPGQCDLGKICHMKSWLVAADYFVNECPEEQKTASGGWNQQCKVSSYQKAKSFALEGCPTLMHQERVVQMVWETDYFTGC